MIEEFIHAVLSQSEELKAYTGGGVYPIIAPRKSVGWHLTYQQISEPEAGYAGAPTETRWQINIVAPNGYSRSNYRSGKTAAKIVKSLMVGFSGDMSGVCIQQIRFENQTDVSDPNTGTFFVAQDYVIKYYGD